MRNVFLRLFALALVVAMGCLAIAHAQRASFDPFVGQDAANNAPANPLRAETPADNTAAPVAGDPAAPTENPMRPQPMQPPRRPLDAPQQPAPSIAPRSAQALQVGPIQDNPLRPAQTDPLRTAQSAPSYDPAAGNPLRPNAFANQARITNDRAVRTVADNEPAGGPALSSPALSGPVQTNTAQNVPITISMGDATTTSEPRLLPPNQAPSEGTSLAEQSPATQTVKAKPNNQADIGPAISPASTLPDMSAAPPVAENRPVFSSTTTAVAAPIGAATNAPLAPTAFRNDAPVRRELPANNGPMNDDNSIAASNPLASGVEGAGRPGERSLEGPQSPQLMVQKIVPPEVQVNRPAVLRTIIRNTGAAVAKDVEVHDMVPKGTRLLGTSPRAQQGPQGELTWSIGIIKPGEESAVEMQVMPVEEGEVGSVATVQFQAAASARSRCTRPRLVVETVGTPQVLMGDEAALTFTVSNPGTGMATGVELIERIPAGAQHPIGKELRCTVGDLRPGESRKFDVRLKAVQAGVIANLIVAKGDAGLKAEHSFSVQVVSPQLNVVMSGPKRRYLEREATYQVSVTNPGTAPAEHVQLVAYLPPGLKFVNANNAGQYDEVNRAVSWRMDELPVNAQGSVQLVTMPIEAGEQSIKLRGTAQRGLTVEKEHPVVVEGLAAVTFQMAHTRDPIEIGGETAYEVSVVNQGSKASTNLRLVLNLPPQLKALAADGPTRNSFSGDQVVFESLPNLPPKSVVTYHVKVKGIQPGDLRVRCQLMTDEMQAPVSKEDSTRVYGDE